MTLLFNHLRRQVLGSAAVGLALLAFVLEEVGPTKVCQLDCAVLVQQNVLGLDVAMDNWGIQTVQVLTC